MLTKVIERLKRERQLWLLLVSHSLPVCKSHPHQRPRCCCSLTFEVSCHFRKQRLHLGGKKSHCHRGSFWKSKKKWWWVWGVSWRWCGQNSVTEKRTSVETYRSSCQCRNHVFKNSAHLTPVFNRFRSNDCWNRMNENDLPKVATQRT